MGFIEETVARLSAELDLFEEQSNLAQWLQSRDEENRREVDQSDDVDGTDISSPEREPRSSSRPGLLKSWYGGTLQSDPLQRARFLSDALEQVAFRGTLVGVQAPVPQKAGTGSPFVSVDDLRKEDNLKMNDSAKLKSELPAAAVEYDDLKTIPLTFAVPPLQDLEFMLRAVYIALHSKPQSAEVNQSSFNQIQGNNYFQRHHSISSSVRRLVVENNSTPQSNDPLLHRQSSVHDPKREDDALMLHHAEWLFVARCTVAIYGLVIQKILDSTMPLSESVLYWRQVAEGNRQAAVYALQVLPWRLVNWCRNGNLLQYLNQIQFHSLRWRHFVRLRNWPWIQLRQERHHARNHALKLLAIQRHLAFLLGTLAEPSMTVVNKKESQWRYLRRHVVQLVVLVRSSLQMEMDSSLNTSRLQLVEDSSLSLAQVYDALLQICQVTQQFPDFVSFQASPHAPPNALQRWWCPVLISFLIGAQLSSQGRSHWQTMVQFVTDARWTLSAFIEDWLWKPLINIYATVRYRQRHLTVLAAETLASDLASLERMVLNYAKEQNISDLTTIANQTRQGDLSLILRRYESEMTQPLRHLVAGDLLQLFLIQVQKLKVDLELTLSALDQLLKSNELNFALLAVIPTLLIVGAGYVNLSRRWQQERFHSRALVSRQIRSQLRQVEVKMTRFYQSDSHQLPVAEMGQLLVDLHQLREFTRRALKPYLDMETRRDFVSDLRELESGRRTVVQKLWTIQRMYRTFPFLSESK